MEAEIFISKVTELEKNEIESLFERINALKALGITLAENSDLLKENQMVAKIVSDLETTQKEFNQWWDKTADKYSLNKSKIGNYRINFFNCSLYYIMD